MLFVSTLGIIPGKTKDLTDKTKNPKMIQGIIIKNMLGCFGKPDIMLIFEAPSEVIAAEFILQFSDCSTIKTQLVFPMKLIDETNKGVLNG
jgi:uncharacterized protein with GYD domain